LDPGGGSKKTTFNEGEGEKENPKVPEEEGYSRPNKKN